MKLVAFDGDNTLWTPLSGVNLTARTPTDDLGDPRFTYHPIADNPLIARRDDGALFALRPEAREVIDALRARGLLVGVVSYNHEVNVCRILDTFGLLDCMDYVVAEWHTHKDRMLDKMLGDARRDGHVIAARDVLLVDDDPEQIYRGQCERMGAAFLCFGADINDLRSVLSLL